MKKLAKIILSFCLIFMMSFMFVGCGETITITYSANAPLQSMNVFGKSWQKTVGGNQLLDAKSLIIANSNNYIFSNVKYSSEGVIPITGGQSYVLSLAKCLTDKGINVFDASNNKLSCTVTNKTVGEGITMSFTAPENAVSMSFYAKITTDGTTSIDLAKPMLNKGTSALPWEQYTGGIASPNPNYPQDIHSNGESGSIEYGVYGANLFNAENPNYLLKATNISVNDNKVTFTTSDQYGQFGNDYRNLPSGTYTFGYESVDCSDVVEVRAYYGSNGTIGTQIARTTTGKSITFEYDSTQGDLIVWTRPNVATTITYTGLCFCFGDTLKNEPYKSPQSFLVQTPNGLNGGLASWDMECNYVDSLGNRYVVDYKDFTTLKNVKYFVDYAIDDFGQVKIAQDSSWYNGEKSYSYELTGSKGYSTSQLSGKILGFCTHLTSYAFSDFYGKGIETGCMNNQGYVVVNISKSLGICKTVDEFVQWCRDNNVIFRKALATPIETDLTEEEIARYKEAHTNYPSTTIINDANAYTEVGYVADTKMYIDEKIAEMCAAMLNV